MTVASALNSNSLSPFPWRPILTLAALAVVVRGLLLLLCFYGNRTTWEEFLTISDAGSFLRMARVLVLGNSPEILSFYDQRVFPGWPLLFGPLLPFVGERLALLLPTLVCAAALPGIFFLLTRSFFASAVVSLLPPAWLIAGVYPMAEPAFLLAAFGAVLAAHRRSWLVAGLLGGLACTIKPYGIFLGAGLAWVAFFATDPSLRMNAVLRVALGGVLPVVGVACLNLARLGELAPQLHVYSASLDQLNIPLQTARLLDSPSGHWDWPFKALVLTPLRVATPAWKIAYIYSHVIAVLILTFRAIARRRLHDDAWERVCLIWLCGNTLASFCAGPYWGFHAFDRYVIWAWPAAAALNRDLLNSKIFLGGFVLSAAASVFAILGK